MLNMIFLPYKGKQLLKESGAEKNGFIDILVSSQMTDDVRKRRDLLTQ